MAIYRLRKTAAHDERNPVSRASVLNDQILFSNVLWFTRVRWIIVFIFISAGASGYIFKVALALTGLAIPYKSLFVMAGMLTAINIIYHLYSLKTKSGDHLKIVVILWTQIIVDLIFVTSLVYNIGSTDTFISFIYMIHIALSCIFFPRARSIFVVSTSSLFYLSCVLLQIKGVLEWKSIFLSSSMEITESPQINIFSAVSAVFIWYVLWYFISRLSEGLRERELSLRIANDELRLADKEKTRKVIVTTHDLKAPFVGIESNISVLKYLHWDELPDSFREILDKIEIRSKTLRERINKILELGNLRMQEKELAISPVSLKALFDMVIGDIADQILEKKIELITDIRDIAVNSNEEKLKILFSNLLSNAVFYTPEMGKIEIKMIVGKNTVNIIISDSGIGIEEKYLDKIFDEYFRTPEAKEFNKMSSGLGLQIVKTVAEQLDLSLEVESEIGLGTAFTVGINVGNGG